MRFDERKHSRGGDGKFISKQDTSIERIRTEFLKRKNQRRDNDDKRKKNQ